MSRITTAFFAAAVLYALAGISLGIFMGASHDFTLRPLHAHINLLGWASLALMGAFYGLAGDRAPARLAWTNFAVSNLGNLGLLSALYVIVNNGKPNLVALLGGQAGIVLGMVLFGAAVLVAGRNPRLTA